MFIHIKETNEKVYIPYDSDSIETKLSSAIYNIEKKGAYYVFKENQAYTNGKIAKAGIFKKTFQFVEDYFSENGKLVRKEMNQPTRLGLFLKGDPGTGKTFLAAKITLKLIETENAVGIYSNKLVGLELAEIVDAIRAKDENRLIVFILDEFEKDYDRLNSSSRDELLAFLDGGKSRDNIMVIATANSLSGIPYTLLERPGRFEKVLEFKIEDKNILKTLVETLVPDSFLTKINVEELFERAKKITNITIDALKSLVRDALTDFLNYGSLFPDKTQLISIPVDNIRRESKPKKKNNGIKWPKWMRGQVTDVDFEDED